MILLDVLGVKGAWKTRLARTLDSWDKLNDSLDNLININKMIAENRIKVEKDAFSDTMIITVSNPENEINNTLINITCHIANPLIHFAFWRGIPVRGCISIGDFYRSSRARMIIGPAVDDAAEYYTKPNWIGVSTTPESTQTVLGSGRIPVTLVRYDIPLKNGKDWYGFAVRWDPPRGVEVPMPKSEIVAELKKLIKIHSDDPLVSSKYRNTLDFFNYIEMNKL